METTDVIARACVAEGVSHAFALLGDGNMHLAAALEREGCQFTHVRHEHCAVSMAMAYSRTAHTIGFATVTCGPGLSQVMTALIAAVRAQIPLVIIAGESPLGLAWYNQALDQGPLVTACGGSYIQVHTQHQLFPKLNEAFAEAREKSRPVVVGIPFDLQESAWTLETTYQPTVAWPTVDKRVIPNRASLDAAVAVINASERIILIGGRGAVVSGAKQACMDLATTVDALVATTLPARGLFHDDPYNLNVSGGFASDAAKHFFAEADLVIVVGGRLASHAADAGRLHPKAQVLQIDTNPVVLSQGRIAATHHLCGDARLTVEALLAHPDLSSRPTRQRVPSHKALIDNPVFDAFEQAATDARLDPRAVITALDAALPKDWMMVNSSGHCSYYAAHMRGRDVVNFLTIREFGAIGNGLAYAAGAAVVKGDIPTVLFDGDGGFLMHVQELETIRRHRLNVLICILNDGGYGSEVHKLRKDRVSEQGAYFGHDDLAAVARGFGLEGYRVESLAQLTDAIDAFKAAHASGQARPTVVDIHISDRIMSPVMRRIVKPR